MTPNQPDELDELEFRTSSRLSHRLEIEHHLGPITIRYARTRFRCISEDTRGIKQREIYGSIRLTGQHAGSFQFMEYDVAPLLSWSQFLQEMDDYSSSAAALAETVLAHWEEPSDLSGYGNIIELQRVRMQLGYSGAGRLRAVLTALLEAEFPSRALLLLKAFPLEYEGRVTDQNKRAFEKRRRAMMRHYRAMLGVKPLPGTSGAEGWMFSIPDQLSAVVEPPVESVEREWF